MQKNARFWIFVNGGPVKVTLAPNEKLHHWQGGPTDEGWESNTIGWHFDGQHVWRDTFHDGRDCDGRLQREQCDVCHVCELNQGPDMDGVYYPDWQDYGSRQRDFSAEAAGY